MSTTIGHPHAAPPGAPGAGLGGGDRADARGRHRVPATMPTASTQNSEPASAMPRRSANRRRTLFRLLLSVEVGLVALVLRLFHITTANDLFVDEVSYATIARNIAAGRGVVLDGSPFFLHPPAFFHELALVLAVRGSPGTLVDTILQLRDVDAFAGAVSAAFVTAVLLRITRGSIAAAAGLVLATDPFLNRWDSRVLLEAPAMAAAAAGIFVLGGVARTRRAAVLRGLGAGALLALSALTKDLYVFVGALPVAVAAVALRGNRRIAHLTAAVTAACGYGAYIVSVFVGGQGPAWWAAKSVGLARAAGTQQETGFNKPGNPSLVSRLFANGSVNAGSYALIGLGVCATAALFLVAWRRRRTAPLRAGTLFVGFWSAGAIIELSYAVLGGTLEEQMFYPLLVVSIAALAVVVDLAWSGPARRWLRTLLRATATLVLVAVLAVDVIAWDTVHTRRDDAYVQFLAWQKHGMAPVSVVSATEGVAQFLMTGVVIGQWATPQELVAHHVDYVVLSTSLTAQGYGLARPALEQLLDRDAPIVYSVTAPTLGQLRVYDTRAWVYSQTHPAAPIRGLR